MNNLDYDKEKEIFENEAGGDIKQYLQMRKVRMNLKGAIGLFLVGAIIGGVVVAAIF